MIKLSIRANGQRQVLLGLTDTNLRRLTSTSEDGSITVRLAELLPPGEPLADDTELLLFHATPETCAELARVLGVEERALLHMLGEDD